MVCNHEFELATDNRSTIFKCKNCHKLFLLKNDSIQELRVVVLRKEE